MPSYPREKIQEIQDRVDIERVIGRTVSLKRQGNRLVRLCPFHKEKSPSFGVDPQKKLFHCFGCQVGGDVFAYVQRMEAVDFGEAGRILAPGGGVGLSNLGARLQALYGPDASLTLDALSPHGTCAQLTLPLLPLNAHDATLPDC